ncbi:MAG: tetratricopeptide repeat protein [Opitutaceae bacterium]
MRNTQIQKYRSGWLLGAMLLFAATGNAQDDKPLVSELLEAGVYQEEARGDLDAAIALYQQVVDSDEISRPKAAEAQYRLAVCYQKQGNNAMAVRSFEALVKNFPNQTEWVDAALAHLPKPFEPELIPWVDGETELMEIRLPTGSVVGYSFYRTEKVVREGRDLWQITNRTLANADIITKVEIDPVTQAPVYGYFNGGGDTKEISWWFDEDQIRSIYGDDPEEKTTPTSGRVIDNLQAHYLVRQMPMEVGFSTQQSIFVGMTGNLIPVTFTVKAVEEVETPLGVFECVQTEIDLAVQKQTIWTSTDASRRLIKFKAGGVEIVASRYAVVEPGEVQTFVQEAMGLAFDVPAEWGIFKNPGNDDSQVRLEIREAGSPVSIQFLANRDDSEEAADAVSAVKKAREIAEKQVERFQKRDNSFIVNEESWESLEVPGAAGVSVTGNLEEFGQAKTLKKVVLRTDNLTIVFNMGCASDQFDDTEPAFDAMVGSLRVD